MTTVPVSIVLLGSGAVGKSSIVLRYIRNSWNDEYDPTIEDSYLKQFKIEVDGQVYSVNLEITDTAGQENYRGLWGDRYLRESDGVILVYSICELETLHELNALAQQIFNVREDSRVPFMVVGNKRDLPKRQVTHLQGSSFTKQIAQDAIFMECSAKTGESVNDCFDILVKQIIRKKFPKRKSMHRSIKKSIREPKREKRHSGFDKETPGCSNCTIL